MSFDIFRRTPPGRPSDVSSRNGPLAVKAERLGRSVRIAGLITLLLVTALAVAHAITPSLQTSAPSPPPTIAAVSALPDRGVSESTEELTLSAANDDSNVEVDRARPVAAVSTRIPMDTPADPLALPAMGVGDPVQPASMPPPRMAVTGLRWQRLKIPCAHQADRATGNNATAQETTTPQSEALCLPKETLMLADTAPVVRNEVLGSPSAPDAGSGSVGRRVRNAVVAMSALPIRAAVTAPAITSAHPRLLLDTTTLAALRQRAAANTPEWQRLKTVCDSYIGGTVNYPTQNAYPDKPNLGPGYQGEQYLPAVAAEGLCYQVLKNSNPTAAASYGAKAVDILMKMSTRYTTDSGNLGQDPCTDDGYGIRNFGVGYGLGYDWLHDLLSPTQRTQVYTAGNAWITAWEKPGGCSAFEFVHPQSNYFAGYFHAKAVIAISSYGDNPSAPAQWDDWLNNQFAKRVQPYYAKHLAGGGWTEGYGNYAPPAIFNMNLPAREVKTATGLDLVHGAAAYTFPLESADYIMHFTWPSRAYFDDRDTNHANGVATPPKGTTPVRVFETVLGDVVFWKSPKAGVLHSYLNEVSAATSGYAPADPWLVFLLTDPNTPTVPVNTLPLSYLAAGIGATAARSDWSTGASWMSFRAGPYVNNPGQGEQGFDQGSLALVRGNAPLLVNTFGWMAHEPNGSADENRLYSDLFGSFDGALYMGNRQIYNVYYVRNMSGPTVVNQFGQAAYTTEDNQVRTQTSAFEDGGDYVHVLGTHLEDMYRKFPGGTSVAAWSRQVMFLRPNRFVVYDRTTSGSAAYDQYLAWHFPANPVKGSTAAGQSRLDVTYNGHYVGAMTTVLPANASPTTVRLYPSSPVTKVWQVQVRPATAGATQRWLTVFDLSSTASAVATTAPVSVTRGTFVGVRLAASDGNSVLLSSSGAPGVAVAGSISYTVPTAAAEHFITDVAARSGYDIVASTASGVQVISVNPGGSYTSSPEGVLNFFVSAAGVVQRGKPVVSKLPISGMPITGWPAPYHR